MPSLSTRDLPDSLQSLQSRPLLVMHLAVRPMIMVGATPGVQRRIGVVSGGQFAGERLSGDVLEGGSDWQALRSDGSVTLDVRLILKTNDDALITISYRGIRHGPADVIKQMERGEAVDPAQYYFRIVASFETAARQYDWINRIVAVGIGHRPAGGPVYSLFEVL